MKRLVFLITLVFLANITSAAPKRMNKCEVGLPKEFNTALIKESTAKNVLKTIKSNGTFNRDNTSNRYWNAYSDRENNYTYESPSLTSPKVTKLEFNQEVRIAKIQNGFAYVYSEKNKQIGNLEISSDAIFHGWIPIDNLLIWPSCVTTEDGIYHKALLCVNLEEFKSATSEAEKNKVIGQGYYHPTKQGSSVQLSTDMNFYFIMKRSNGLALLAKQPRLDVATISTQMLLAWVPEVSFVPWNQRSCLEPTWEFEDADAFANQEKKIYIYDTKEKLAAGNTNNSASNIPFIKRTPKIDREKQYIYRMPGKDLRFPILDGTTPNVYNLSTFAQVGSNNTTSVASTINEFELARVEGLRKKQNINLAIVIDGTTSMKPYYAAVKDAIKKGCDYFGNNYKIKVGIVIYRDYADGDNVTEYMQFTDARSSIGRTKINSFLDTGGNYGIQSSNKDTTLEEALYYGIDFALNTLDFKEGESNMMLVVGDCGNDKNDTKIREDNLIENIVAKQVSIMGFQVQNKDDEAYGAFNGQLLRLIRSSLTKTYKQLDTNVKVEGKSFGVNYDYEATNSNEKFYFGNYRCADADINDGKMDTAKLTDLMSNTILTFAGTIQTQLDVAANTKPTSFKRSQNNDNNGTLNLNQAVLRNLVGEELFDKVANANSTVNFRGYTNKTINDRNCFKPVIFLSRDEFQHLLKQMEGVYNAALNQDYVNREPFIKAMKAMVRSFLPGISEGDLNNMTNEDITRMIGGLHESADILKLTDNYSIAKLGDEQHVSKATYMNILRKFQEKYRKLNIIFGSKTYKYIKDFNGIKYYWIPIDELP